MLYCSMLSLRANVVPELPNGLSDLRDLELLRVGANQLQSLNPCIGKLTKLQVLCADISLSTEHLVVEYPY
jgi:hypothetical protein